MKNSDSEIKAKGKEEKKMKIKSVVKISVYAATLGFACMLPMTAHAQSDMAPDEFAFSATEITVAQPVQVANATTAAKPNFEGKVSLPYDVKCGSKNLKAGQYLLSVKSEGTSQVVTINGGGQNMNMTVREVSTHRASSQSALLVRKSNEGRKLQAVYVEGLKATLYLEASTDAGQARIERLPIS
jgi:hypothetical protein